MERFEMDNEERVENGVLISKKKNPRPEGCLGFSFVHPE
jgi:hypothetical protein